MTYQQQPQRNLVSQADQAMIERSDVPRSTFLCEWTRKTSFDAGYLIPFMWQEILPGDHMTYDVTAFLRMATPLFPLFDNQRIDTFFFYVPARILWANWIRFMGEQDVPTDTIAYTVPVVASAVGGFVAHSLFDHMGLPVVGQTDPAQIMTVNCLPLRAYMKIYHDWFRDENLGFSSRPGTGDGPDVVGSYFLWKRAKSHDYFTSALPWPQKFTAPTIPLVGNAPIRGLGIDAAGGFVAGAQGVFETPGTGFSNPASYAFFRAANTAAPNQIFMRGTAGGVPDVFADLAAVSGITLNSLRLAWMTQQLLERDARGGTRYTEIVRSHFGVSSPDMRLQRAEYIGGGSSPLSVTPVAQTAPTTGLTVGALGAAATAVGQHHASYAATEHGYVVGIINVRSDLSYQQGLHKGWSRSTRYDFYWPSLALLGEQAILQKELYCTGVAAADNLVFGYQERWMEYRTRTSEVTGIFRSTTALTLDPWHLAQKFTSAPTLGQTFIEDTPPMTRVLAAGALAVNQQYLADILVKAKMTRALPMFGTPARLGRF